MAWFGWCLRISLCGRQGGALCDEGLPDVDMMSSRKGLLLYLEAVWGAGKFGRYWCGRGFDYSFEVQRA